MSRRDDVLVYASDEEELDDSVLSLAKHLLDQGHIPKLVFDMQKEDAPNGTEAAKCEPALQKQVKASVFDFSDFDDVDSQRQTSMQVLNQKKLSGYASSRPAARTSTTFDSVIKEFRAAKLSEAQRSASN
eukprot:CAMPEP_0184657102 /NCGR_PEP_ID=MMETSP0308-20130426/16977_1 /TAXON_ID=38269 /ORGANISM="Gloeochaete witrockiana, Strain SAG 46.84" /LENGTH=129 /DNA_ID=CAMNT_0027094509 /DNA_START=78 /DNA_END=470 /DNA_ORIENTATION=-